jgi:hypothetical protein
VAADPSSLTRNAKAAAHYANRVVITLRHNIDMLRQLHTRVEEANVRAASTAGRASTLNPLDAVRYLNADQRADLCQGLARDQYQAAARDRERASQELAAARRAASSLRLSLLHAEGSSTVPDEMRTQLRSALASFDQADEMRFQLSAPLSNAGEPGNTAPGNTAPGNTAPVPPTSGPASVPPTVYPDTEVDTLGELFGDGEVPR